MMQARDLAGYGSSPPDPRWPGGARVAVWVGVNVEHYAIDKPSISIVPPTVGLVPDPANYGWRDYGMRVGIWRLADVLDRHGMRTCALVNAEVCELYPELVEEGRARGWTWLAHGRDNSTFQTGMERDLILKTLRTTRANRTEAARQLGISVRTLRNKLNEYRALGIDVDGMLEAAAR